MGSRVIILPDFSSTHADIAQHIRQLDTQIIHAENLTCCMIEEIIRRYVYKHRNGINRFYLDSVDEVFRRAVVQQSGSLWGFNCDPDTVEESISTDVGLLMDCYGNVKDDIEKHLKLTKDIGSGDVFLNLFYRVPDDKSLLITLEDR